MNNSRICPRCGQEKPLSLEHWHSAGTRAGKQRFKLSVCKKCSEKWLAPEGMRVCRGCKNIFPADAQHFATHESGLRARCKTCFNAAGRKNQSKWIKTPRGQATLKTYQARPDVRARSRELERKRNAEKRPHVLEVKRQWRQRNPEKIKDYKRRHFEKNPQRYRLQWRVWASRRRALKRQTPVEMRFNANDVVLQAAAQKNLCWWCGADISGGFEVDHHIALALGGLDARNNIVCACKACNRSKYKKLPWEFNGRLL